MSGSFESFRESFLKYIEVSASWHMPHFNILVQHLISIRVWLISGHAGRPRVLGFPVFTKLIQ